MECQHLYFKQEDQLVRMNEQRTGNGTQQVLVAEYQRFVLTGITFISRKFEGCIPSSIGARLIPVDGLVGWQMKIKLYLSFLVDKLCNILLV